MEKGPDMSTLPITDRQLVREIYLLLDQCLDIYDPMKMHGKVSMAKVRCVSILCPELLDREYSEITEAIKTMTL